MVEARAALAGGQGRPARSEALAPAFARTPSPPGGPAGRGPTSGAGLDDFARLVRPDRREAAREPDEEPKGQANPASPGGPGPHPAPASADKGPRTEDLGSDRLDAGEAGTPDAGPGGHDADLGAQDRAEPSLPPAAGEGTDSPARGTRPEPDGATGLGAGSAVERAVLARLARLGGLGMGAEAGAAGRAHAPMPGAAVAVEPSSGGVAGTALGNVGESVAVLDGAGGDPFAALRGLDAAEPGIGRGGALPAPAPSAAPAANASRPLAEFGPAGVPSAPPVVAALARGPLPSQPAGAAPQGPRAAGSSASKMPPGLPGGAGAEAGPPPSARGSGDPAAEAERADAAVPQPEAEGGGSHAATDAGAGPRDVAAIAAGSGGEAAGSVSSDRSDGRAGTGALLRHLAAAAPREAGAEAHLDPPELGSLRLVARDGREGLSVVIEAARPGTRALLLRHADELRAELRAQGIEGATVSVVEPGAAHGLGSSFAGAGRLGDPSAGGPAGDGAMRDGAPGRDGDPGVGDGPSADSWSDRLARPDLRGSLDATSRSVQGPEASYDRPDADADAESGPARDASSDPGREGGRGAGSGAAPESWREPPRPPPRDLREGTALGGRDAADPSAVPSPPSRRAAGRLDLRL